MPRKNAVETLRLQLTVAKAIHGVLEEMASTGIHGRNKAEVAAWIISSWIWDNGAALKQNNGISLVSDKGDPQT